MKKIFACVLAAALAMGVFGVVHAGGGDDDEDDNDLIVKLEDCPAAVQKAIKDTVGGATIVKLEKETAKGGAVRYEAEYTVDGKKHEVKFSPEGAVLSKKAKGEKKEKHEKKEKKD